VSAIIVDASIGVKWFVPEVHAVEARRWRNPPQQLHTLAVFFDIEFCNVLWKKIQRAEISSADSRDIVRQLPLLPVARHSEQPLLSSAFDIAEQYHRSIYDSIYLALAVQLKGRMVTADQRLYNSLTTTPLASHIAWVADAPKGP
jgi:predicted nucleic acid-binding protein